MTDTNWQNCINDVSSSMVTNSGKMEKVDTYAKLANGIPSEVKALFSDEGVYESLESILTFLESKKEPAQEPALDTSTQRSTLQSGVVGVQHATDDLMDDEDLLNDAVQLVGRRRGLPAAAPSPPAKKPATTTKVTPKTAANLQQQPKTPKMAATRSDSPQPPTCAAQPATTGVQMDLDTTFLHNLKANAIDPLKGRAKETVSQAAALVHKLATMEIASVKPGQPQGLEKKICDIATKQRTIAGSIAGTLDSLAHILRQIATFAENQTLPSADAKKGAKTAKKTGAKTCDSDAMFDATMSLERSSVFLGLYVYRATWECCFELSFSQKDYATMTWQLSTEQPGEIYRHILTLHDLEARAVPMHEVLDVQSTAIEEKLGIMLAKSWSSEDMRLLVTAFFGVQTIQNAKVAHQLSIMHILLHPEDSSRDDLNNALSTCRSNTHGVFHHLRYQKTGAELKSSAAKRAGSLIGQHLCTSKMQRLAELLKSSTPVFNKSDAVAHAACTEIHSISSLIIAQTSGNTAFNTEHATTFESLHVFNYHMRMKFRETVATNMEAFVGRLYCADMEMLDGAPICQAGQALALATAAMSECNNLLDDLSKVLGKTVADAERPAVEAYHYFCHLHSSTRVASDDPSAANITVVMLDRAKSQDITWKTDTLRESADAVDDYYTGRVMGMVIENAIVSSVESFWKVVKTISPTLCICNLPSKKLDDPAVTQQLTAPTDMALFSTTYHDAASAFRDIAGIEVPSEPKPHAHVLARFHAKCVHHALPGGSLFLGDVLATLVNVKEYYSATDVTLCINGMADQKAAQDLVEHFMGPFEVKAHALRGVLKSLKQMQRTRAAGNPFAAFESLGGVVSFADLGPLVDATDVVSFADLEPLVDATDKWLSASKSDTGGRAIAFLTEAGTHLTEVVALTKALKAAEGNFQKTDIMETLHTFIHSHASITKVSQLAWALNTVLTKVSRDYVDLDFVEDILTPDLHISHK